MSGGHLQYSLFFHGRPEPIRQSSLLMVLASSIGNGEMLIKGLRSLASESRGPYAKSVGALSEALEEGHALSEALMIAPPLLPEQTVIAIRAAERTGSLRQILADEAARLTISTASQSGSRKSPYLVAMWLAAVLVIMMYLVSFLMIWIVPKFKKIFQDFDVELPDSTLTLIGLSDFAFGSWPLFLLPVITMTFVTVWSLFWWRYQWLTYGRVMYAEHFVRWQTPIILRLLGVAVAAEAQLTDTLHAILSEMRPGRAARKLSAARLRIEGGEDCWEALQHEGFLKPREVNFLHASRKSSHLDWGLVHLARSFRQRHERLSNRITNIMIPVSILFMGAVVMFIATAVFMPLISLIEHLQ